jgi:hypothetical protein
VSAAVFDRSKLTALRDEFAAKSAGLIRTTSLESIEWARLHVQTRMLMLLVAGVDGDSDNLEGLALRDWHELPRPEQMAVRISIRGIRSELLGLVALTRLL